VEASLGPQTPSLSLWKDQKHWIVYKLWWSTCYTECSQSSINSKRLITFHSGHILQNVLFHSSDPIFKFLFIGPRCDFDGWWVMRLIL
jgi:hypothetical protein